MSLIVPQKTCTKCKITKPVTDFARSTIHRDGYYSSCKACKSAYEQAYRAANLNQVRERARKSQAKRAESHREKGRRYYADNREHILERTAAYQKAHPEVSRAAQAKYKAVNRDQLLPQVRQRSADWRERNRDKDRAASIRWRKANPDAYRAIQWRRKARMKGNGGEFTMQEWQDLKARYDYRCLRCGASEPEIVLTVDHVIPIARGGLNVIENIQPLCRACNSSKNARATDYRP